MRLTPSRFDNVDLTPQPLPGDLSAVTCRDALGWWIECRCTNPACYGNVVHTPLRRLLEHYHCDAVPVLEVAKRMRCKRCRAQPSGLALIDNAAGSVHGMRTRPAGGSDLPTRIDLLPILAAQARGATTALPVTGTTWLEPVTARDLARDPAKRALLGKMFALEGSQCGPLLSTDRSLGGGELGARQGEARGGDLGGVQHHQGDAGGAVGGR